MDSECSAAPIQSVAELAGIPISFTVTHIFDVISNGGGFVLAERSVAKPYTKNYDEIPGEGPAEWARRFDISNWGFIRARSSDGFIGGAVVARDTADVIMLEGRRDLAVLWDIRVMPEFRGQGIGSGLLAAAEAWAISKGCRQFKVETQNVNVPACRFYQRHRFVLRAIDPSAYPELPGEIQLLWYKDLR
jgi:GNAT superfamily N-acetyltransferase